MRTTHRNKALLGFFIWLCTVLLLVGVIISHPKNPDSPVHFLRDFTGGLICLDVFAMLFSFMWSCYHLAKGKGYPGALAVMGFLGPLAQIAVLVALYVMEDKNSKNRAQGMIKAKQRPHVSNIERIVICRRNAVVGIVFGLAGIFVGILLVIFRIGIFKDHQNELILGIIVFFCGYSGVIAGCSYWIKAKNWPDAVVIIGLMPFGVMFIPYVRLIFLFNIKLLIAGMVMIPLILVVVVSVLPDKSGWVGRKRWRIRD